MDKDRTNQPNQSNKSKGSDLPGTSKDPKGQVIRDKPSQSRDRQDERDSDRSRSGYRDPNSDAQRRS